MILSIRRYLLGYLISALLTGTALIGIAIYFNTRHEIDELFDEHLRQLARTVIHQQDNLDIPDVPVTGLSSATNLKSKKRQIKGEEEFLIQIWNLRNELVYSSHPLIAFPMKDEKDVAISDFEGRGWKSYLMKSDHYLVQVSQPLKARSEMIREIGLNNLIPILIQIPLLSFLIWIAVGRSLFSLESLSNDLRLRQPNSFDRINSGEVPLEVKHLVDELNHLMQRQEAALTVQRQFTSNAAHELRTPLTAIQLQADLLARAESTPERLEANTKLRLGVERAAHLIQQLLTMARIESSHGFNAELSALAPLVQDVLTLQTPYAQQKAITITYDLDESAVAVVVPENLTMAMSTLVDNALRYTPQGGVIHISLQAGATEAVLTIIDNGPGIPVAEREKVFERFYRIAGSNVSGTGLGLSMAREIIERYQGDITLHDTTGGGLTVTITLKTSLSDPS